MGEYIVKEFKPGPLLHPTTVFVDAPNLIYYADVRVLERLWQVTMSPEGDLYRRMFASLPDLMISYGHRRLPEMTQHKSSKNILYDIVEWGPVKEICTEKTPFQYLDDLYNTLLFDLPEIGGSFIPTTIGHALKILIDDHKLEKMYLYLPTTNIKETYDELASFFQVGTNDKLELISGGPIGTAIVSANASEYFLNDIQHARHVAAIETDSYRRIYVPAIAHNFNHDINHVMLKGKYVENIGDDLYQTYNIDINLIKVPF